MCVERETPKCACGQPSHTPGSWYQLTNRLDHFWKEVPIRDVLQIHEDIRVSSLVEVVIGPVHVDLDNKYKRGRNLMHMVNRECFDQSHDPIQHQHRKCKPLLIHKWIMHTT